MDNEDNLGIKRLIKFDDDNDILLVTSNLNSYQFLTFNGQKDAIF